MFPIMTPPYFLVALPQLNDEHFSRCVVLVGSHTDEGASGFIINKPLKDETNALTQMVAEVKDVSGETLFEYEEDIFEGGPVNQEVLFAFHDIEELGSEESRFAEGLYLSNDPEVFQKLLEVEVYSSRRRFVLGSAGWGAGQIESEIRAGSWLMVPFKSHFLFGSLDLKDHPDWQNDLWKKVLISGGCDPLTLVAQGHSDTGYN